MHMYMCEKGNKEICDMMNVMHYVCIWVHGYWMRNGYVCAHGICDWHRTKGYDDNG